MKSILVFCGANSGNSEKYTQCAHEVAALLVKNNMKLIFGGGNVGLMGVLSNRMLDLGGTVVGVMPQRLIDREVANLRCTELHVVDSMSERKNKMEAMADAIVTLPGGFGSMDEIFESLTNAQLGIHQKPIVIFNLDGFYDSLLVQLDKMEEEGFLKKENKEKLLVVDTPEALIQLLNRCI